MPGRNQAQSSTVKHMVTGSRPYGLGVVNVKDSSVCLCLAYVQGYNASEPKI